MERSVSGCLDGESSSVVQFRSRKQELQSTVSVSSIGDRPRDGCEPGSLRPRLPKTLNRSPVRVGGVVVLTRAASQGVGCHELFGPGGCDHGVPRPRREFSNRDLWIDSPSLSPETVGLLFHSRVRSFQTPESLLRAMRERLGGAVRECPPRPVGAIEERLVTDPDR